MTVMPDSVNILGHEYTIEYKDNPVDVDRSRRESLWGQIDFWTRTIRIYTGDKPNSDIWHTLIHEVLHGISSDLNLVLGKDEHHDDLDVLALALTDVLFRNGWMK